MTNSSFKNFLIVRIFLLLLVSWTNKNLSVLSVFISAVVKILLIFTRAFSISNCSWRKSAVAAWLTRSSSSQSGTATTIVPDLRVLIPLSKSETLTKYTLLVVQQPEQSKCPLLQKMWAHVSFLQPWLEVVLHLRIIVPPIHPPFSSAGSVHKVANVIDSR